MTIARLIAGREQHIIHCSPQETVRDAAERLADNRIGAMPVLEGGRVIGIFSERDLLYCIAEHGDGALDLLIGEVMTLRRIRHLPVLDGDRLVAFVSIGDLVKHRLELVEYEAQAMREYIRTA